MKVESYGRQVVYQTLVRNLKVFVWCEWEGISTSAASVNTICVTITIVCAHAAYARPYGTHRGARRRRWCRHKNVNGVEQIYSAEPIYYRWKLPHTALPSVLSRPSNTFYLFPYLCSYLSLCLFHTYQPADKPLLEKCVIFAWFGVSFAWKCCASIQNVWAWCITG